MELKLGKLPARVDGRTLRLKSILRALPPPPASFDVDQNLPVPMLDNNMYLNDQYGDCVIAGRAHMTLRFEDFEQSLILPITDQEVQDEYFKETGGSDSGLNMLLSMIAWRKGWIAAGKTYSIYAFGALTSTDHLDISQTIYLLRGAYPGIQVPQSAIDQFNAGQTWDVVSNDGGIKGGHCIYLPYYDSDGVGCITWGKHQFMTWDFWDKYSDEAYGIVDNRDDWLGEDSPVDVAKLDAYLNEITGDPIPPGSNCQFSKGVAKTLNTVWRACGKKTRFIPMVENGGK